MLSRYASHRVIMPASLECPSNCSVRNGLPDAGRMNAFTYESGPHMKFVMVMMCRFGCYPPIFAAARIFRPYSQYMFSFTSRTSTSASGSASSGSTFTP